MEIVAADVDTQTIEGATDSSEIGKKLEEIGIPSDRVSSDGVTVIHIKVDGSHCRYGISIVLYNIYIYQN